MREIRYNANNWREADYEKVFGLTPKSIVDIEIKGKVFKGCKLKFCYGAGFLRIDVKIPDATLSSQIHDGSLYPDKPFYSYASRREEMKIHFNGHSYQWRCGDEVECEFCGKSKKNIGNCKFYIDDEETIFSPYCKNSLAIKS